MSETHGPQSFWTRYVFSTDHKTIGKQYIFTGIFMAVFGTAWSIMIRLQLAWPEGTWPILSKIAPGLYEGGVLLPEYYLSLITMHGTIMIFFVISFALVSGLGNFIIPLHVGARDMAYPFLNMLSYWTIVPACLLMLGSFFVPGGAAAAGWSGGAAFAGGARLSARRTSLGSITASISSNTAIAIAHHRAMA